MSLEIPRLVILEDPDWSFNHNSNDLQKVTWRDAQDRPYAFIHYIEPYYWIHWIDYASYCIEPGMDIVIARTIPGVNKDLVREIYFKSILPYVIQLSGMEVIHASSISTTRGLVGFCGVSGSGKSTIAFGMYRLGYSLWSDDSLVFFNDQSIALSQKIPSEVRLVSESYEYMLRANFSQIADHYQHLKGKPDNDNPDKAEIALLFLVVRNPNQLGEPHIKFTRLSGAPAFHKLLQHAYTLELENDLRKQKMLEAYLGLLNRVPIVELSYSTNLEHFPLLLTDIQAQIDRECT